MTTKRLAHGSLFSGIGGAELAAHWAGYDNVFHCEINPFGRKVLDFWFPDSQSYDDVKKTDFKEWRGRVDVLSAGFPCQPFSSAGKRKGADDDRYLWPETLRVLREVLPTWFIGENVAGLLSMVEQRKVASMDKQATLFDEGDGLFHYRATELYTIERICRDLEASGYSVQPFVIPACAVGAPHRRDRVWFVARRQTRQDGRPAADSDDFRLVETDARRVRREEGRDGLPPQPQGEKERGDALRGGAHGAAADTSSLGLQASGTKAELHEQRLGRLDIDGRGIPVTETDGGICGRGGIFEYTHGEGLQRNVGESGQGHGKEGGGNIQTERAALGLSERGGDSRIPRPSWEVFPTQPPLLGGDDGLPSGMDSLSISYGKFRNETIKAMGNAWVPQVAYEILMAIKEEES